MSPKPKVCERAQNAQNYILASHIHLKWPQQLRNKMNTHLLFYVREPFLLGKFEKCLETAEQNI